MAEPGANAVTPADLNNSKDIGKLAERMARVETRFDHLDERLDKIDKYLDRAQVHDEMACTAWRALTALFTVLKWTLPPGGLLGLIVVAKEWGLL